MTHTSEVSEQECEIEEQWNNSSHIDADEHSLWDNNKLLSQKYGLSTSNLTTATATATATVTAMGTPTNSRSYRSLADTMKREIEALQRHLTEMSRKYYKKVLQCEEMKTQNRNLLLQTKKWKHNYAKLRQQYFHYQEFVINTYTQKFNTPLTFLSDRPLLCVCVFYVLVHF
ncbi:hypothetical protein RFI_07540 [Reticulomyxa filosa]|uniref:Uncharacterized protein n=1 Tax=Reticulomyxa filosa TaxID=46433 RepID=X6NTH1_RETFI|nr:hypothetical protein RFI_07540 [Reticulomyxa filosa]|eukprot:ETO29580.1 hypothetical protein RFI_07540 [Reticulomyxa filosa]